MACPIIIVSLWSASKILLFHPPAPRLPLAAHPLHFFLGTERVIPMHASSLKDAMAALRTYLRPDIINYIETTQ